MSKALKKTVISERTFAATVHNRGGRFVVCLEHAFFGEKVESEHTTLEEASAACDKLAAEKASDISHGISRLLQKYGPGIAAGVGPERALEMVEKNEVSL